MVLRLDSKENGFKVAFEGLRKNTTDNDALSKQVAKIISEIKDNGDSALINFMHKYDGKKLTPDELIIKPTDVSNFAAKCTVEVREALDFATKRIFEFHNRQMPKDIEFSDEFGTDLGLLWKPLSAAGLYVPGGTAAYPSSLLMNAIPAIVAGVERLAIAVSTSEKGLHPAVAAAIDILGLKEVYQISGAQAIASLAYGTETILAVDKIVGPGNRWVTEAKRQMTGIVGIDMIAGPSEILVVADRHNRADWIAADLLSQAEHDEFATAILITDCRNFADSVEKSVEKLLKTLPRKTIASKSWHNQGAILLVNDFNEIPDLINKIAPEHLELAVSEPSIIFNDIKHVGAVFLGRYTPEAIGDYVAGPNHVLPTSGNARFSSGLSVYDFLKRTTFTRCTSNSISKIGPHAITLAETEGLSAHALSLKLRLENSSGN